MINGEIKEGKNALRSICFMHFCIMFKKLRKRWGVNSLNLLLIICTFALGGRLCEYSARNLLFFSKLDEGLGWFILYILLMSLLWPLAVIVVSIPLGQFSFFKRYIQKILAKMTGKRAKKGQNHTKMAIFASGMGTNAKNIISHFKTNSNAKVELIVCNNPTAGVINVAKENGIPILLIDKNSLNDPGQCLAELQKKDIHFIVLAGFLWKLPPFIVKAFPKQIINIHPALLPNFGGKGMYGQLVHQSVIANREKKSGITIHLVDEIYDNGEILFQASCEVTADDSPESLAKKIHLLEEANFPSVIEQYLQNQR